MSRKSALAVLVAGCVAVPCLALAAPESDCAQLWKSADSNGDGVLMGPEANRYFAYYRLHARTVPADGKITQNEFMRSCQDDVFVAKAPGADTSIKGVDGVTEEQIKDHIMAAGMTSVSSVVKDGNGVWRASAMKDGKAVRVFIDEKGNVVSDNNR